MCLKSQLYAEVSEFLRENAEAVCVVGIKDSAFDDLHDVLAAVLFAATGIDRALLKRVYDEAPDLAAISAYDILETTRRNFEPGGAAATLMFGRGAQAIAAHRVAHALWQNGEHMLALAVKSRAGRVFSTDIHPAAKIGAGLWLDHGLGFVVGETCVIGKNVSIWHNVTLGSTLGDSGTQRHPVVQDGVVIGAGAIILGNVTIGTNANVAAGAIVVKDVPPSTVVVGAKAREIGSAQISFAPPEDTD